VSLTDEERELVIHIGQCSVLFGRLPQYHSSDQRDFTRHVHALQNIVMSREAVRSDSDILINMQLPESPLVPLPLTSRIEANELITAKHRVELGEDGSVSIYGVNGDLVFSTGDPQVHIHRSPTKCDQHCTEDKHCEASHLVFDPR
jgi:hypothetical protein